MLDSGADKTFAQFSHLLSAGTTGTCLPGPTDTYGCPNSQVLEKTPDVYCPDILNIGTSNGPQPLPCISLPLVNTPANKVEDHRMLKDPEGGREGGSKGSLTLLSGCLDQGFYMHPIPESYLHLIPMRMHEVLTSQV